MADHQRGAALDDGREDAMTGRDTCTCPADLVEPNDLDCPLHGGPDLSDHYHTPLGEAHG